MNNSETEAIVMEPPTATMSKEDLAGSFRTQSFHMMEAHPIAAAHLVLAAASIAPTCAAEQDVAEEFAYAIADFAQQFGVLHRRAVRRREQEAAGGRSWASMTATTCVTAIASVTGQGGENTQRNDKKTRREALHDGHRKAVPLGSASWIGGGSSSSGGSEGAWFDEAHGSTEPIAVSTINGTAIAPLPSPPLLSCVRIRQESGSFCYPR